MKDWADNIQSDHLYQVEENQLSESNLIISGASKLSLFSEEDFELQRERFFDLCTHLPKTFQFKYCDAAQGEFWEIYADNEDIDSLVAEHLVNDVFDYLLWPRRTFEPPKLLLFDMDSTFIQIEVIDELAKCHGVGEKVVAVTESAMQGELDFTQSLISRVACLRGLSARAIDEIAEKLPLSEGVDVLVNASHRGHAKVAIVSGGFMPFVEKLKQKMPLFQVKANRLDVADGVLTGDVTGEIIDASKKADFLLALCKQLSISPDQAMAIGDGANDLLMMQAAGFCLAYRAKPAVRSQARGQINRTHLGRLVDIFGWDEG